MDHRTGTVDAPEMYMLELTPSSLSFPGRFGGAPLQIVRHDSRLKKRANAHQAPASQKKRVAICLSSSPADGELLLRSASQVAQELDADLYAVHVARSGKPGAKVPYSLIRNLILASRFGARLIWLEAPDVVSGLLDWARAENITRMFVRAGRPGLMGTLWRRSVWRTLVENGKGVPIEIVGLGRQRRLASEAGLRQGAVEETPVVDRAGVSPREAAADLTAQMSGVWRAQRARN